MPLRNKHHEKDPLWHVQLSLGVIVLIQLALFALTNYWVHALIPLLELVLMAAIQLFTPKTATFSSRARRMAVVVMITAIAVANIFVLQQLIYSIAASHSLSALQLLTSGAYTYLTTLGTFALLYWEMDGGGPGERRKDLLEQHDFLFPQQHLIKLSLPWHATFLDYLYISLTNMTNFTSSDSIPLSRRAKVLMGVQSVTSVITIVLIIARAISTI